MLNRHQNNVIKITSLDAERLEELVTAEKKPLKNSVWVRRLDMLVKNAVRVPSQNISSERITMNSRIRLLDNRSREMIKLWLAYPRTRTSSKPAGLAMLSILTPLGLAVLGRKTGDVIAGRIVVEKLLYQPEADGDFNL